MLFPIKLNLETFNLLKIARFTCKTSGCSRYSKMPLCRDNHIFHFGTKFIIILIWCEAIIDHYLERHTVAAALTTDIVRRISNNLCLKLFDVYICSNNQLSKNYRLSVIIIKGNPLSIR